MHRSFRAGRWAAALSMLVTFFISPTTASASDGRIQQSFSVTAPAQAGSAPEAAPTAVPAQTGVTAPVAAPAPVPTTAEQLRTLAAAGYPLEALVGTFVDARNQDEEQLCLAKAIYFEARGETLQGQLAVAEVVLNRASSGRYPTTICGVVTQPAQFSFIRRGRFPAVNAASESWRRALAIAEIARNNIVDQIPPYVLWYHANYVAPSWGRRLTRITQIGAHIFYG